MVIDGNIYFTVTSPLKVEVSISVEYWKYLIAVKHRIMTGKEDIVKSALIAPDEIRRSRTDSDVFLYYRQYDRLYCVVAKHTGMEGFVITAYPTDKVKEGDIIWTK